MAKLFTERSSEPAARIHTAHVRPGVEVRSKVSPNTMARVEINGHDDERDVAYIPNGVWADFLRAQLGVVGNDGERAAYAEVKP